MYDDSRLMLFELAHSGHQADFLGRACSQWNRMDNSRRLDVLVTPAFFDAHPLMIRDVESRRVRYHCLSDEEFRTLRSFGPGDDPDDINEILLYGNRPGYPNAIKWGWFRRYLTRLRATHGLLMSADGMLYAILCHEPLPCDFSAIYFHPSAHYDPDRFDLPDWFGPKRTAQQKLVVGRVLRHPRLDTLFSLDPYFFQAMDSDGRIRFLPHPVVHDAASGSSDRLRLELGVEPGRVVILQFGEMHRRKGILALLEGVARLPEHRARQLCLVLAGNPASDRGFQRSLEAAIGAYTGPAQIVTRFDYIADHEVPSFFEMAEIVTLLYHWHVGMSGVQILAASHHKPVLGTRYYTLGRINAEYGLGECVDPASAGQIAGALESFLDTGWNHRVRAAGQRELTAQHTSGGFVSSLLRCRAPGLVEVPAP